MELLNKYMLIQNELFEYFGYVENWRAIPIDDATEYYWTLSGEDSGDNVKFSETKDKLDSDGDYYCNEVYTQRHLPKWVYRGKDFTMICVNTNVDGNKFLQIFSNDKEVN